MKKDHKLHLVKDDVTPHPLAVEIKDKILAECDIDRTCTHTTGSPLYETMASLIITKESNQGQ